MEASLHAIGNLRAMEIIDIKTGSRLGFVKDFKIDCSEYKIISIILPNQVQKLSWFSKSEDLEIPWEKIIKIGVDVILIDGTDIAGINKE